MTETYAPLQEPGALPPQPAYRARFRHPQFKQVVNLEAWPQPEADPEATAATIRLMSQFTLADSRADLIRAAAAQATAGAATPEQAAAMIHAWVKSHVHFVEDAEPARLAGVPDPQSAEVLIRPIDLLRMPRPSGDCDDFSMLVAAMLLAQGIEPAFKTIKADAENPGAYTHVYVIAKLPTGDLPIDASHGPAAGWEHANLGAQVWPIVPRRHALGSLRAIDWGGLIQTGASTAADIFKARYGQPPPGTYIAGNGQTIYRQQPGATDLNFPGIAAGGSGLTLGLMALGGLILVAVLMRGGSR